MDFQSDLRNTGGNGQALLEFALLLPLLLLVLFGALDLGRVFSAAITVTNAAREGARYISLHPDEFAGMRSVVIAEGSNSGIVIDGGDIDVDCVLADDECTSGKAATVTVSYSFDLILGWVIPSPVEITRSVTMIVQ